MAQKKITDLQLIAALTSGANFAVDDGIQSYRVTPDQVFTYMRPKFPAWSFEIANLQITTAVASSALTIALKTNAGTDASSTDKIRVAFRNSTLTSGAYSLREISAALSMVVSSGSTLGQASGNQYRLYVYLIDNAGAAELAVSQFRFSENALVSTTAEGGAGAADSATVMYSTSARSNVACRLIGYILNTQTTAGTWASAGTQIELMPVLGLKNSTVTVLTSGSAATYTTPAGATRLRVRLVGGGGGGTGSGTTPGAPGAGTSSTFDTLVAGNNGSVNTGGDVSLLGAVGTGGNGGVVNSYGGAGGSSALGGAGAPGAAGNPGGAARTNSGGGGGGAGCGTTTASGAGGAAGGYVEKLISQPAASYTYTVGSGGAGGTAGTSGFAGAAGASGLIIVEEYYD